MCSSDLEAKKASEKDLQSIEDKDVKDIVQVQVSLGFRAITDGEYRRHMVWVQTMKFVKADNLCSSGDLSGQALRVWRKRILQIQSSSGCTFLILLRSPKEDTSPERL